MRKTAELDLFLTTGAPDFFLSLSSLNRTQTRHHHGTNTITEKQETPRSSDTSCPPNLPALPHLPILRPIFLLGTPHPPSQLSPLGSSPFSALLDRVSSQRPGRTTHRPIFILRFCPITAQVCPKAGKPEPKPRGERQGRTQAKTGHIVANNIPQTADETTGPRRTQQHYMTYKTVSVGKPASNPPDPVSPAPYATSYSNRTLVSDDRRQDPPSVIYFTQLIALFILFGCPLWVPLALFSLRSLLDFGQGCYPGGHGVSVLSVRTLPGVLARKEEVARVCLTLLRPSLSAHDLTSIPASPERTLHCSSSTALATALPPAHVDLRSCATVAGTVTIMNAS
ncbi:uncharacterized protein CLUP02_05427 [Colletotrichum lupini]|uniref:Uncharacterized protein n=1 Tax=Colletotrichum lupini TaxID=145971 RepID=A0A9Q8SNA8_9PEZI|nr:uncharacterized protein CLUP02_05427 [Colletotrichum lupini]UQC79946.1 hypothetical protein CLUP02_05427 [Colletotrichum lupini]